MAWEVNHKRMSMAKGRREGSSLAMAFGEKKGSSGPFGGKEGSERRGTLVEGRKERERGTVITVRRIGRKRFQRHCQRTELPRGTEKSTSSLRTEEALGITPFGSRLMRPMREIQVEIETEQGCRDGGGWPRLRLAEQRPTTITDVQTEQILPATEQDWRWPVKRLKEKSKADAWKRVGSVYQEQSTLPLHLVVHHVMPRLSLRQLCRLRCVCRAWNAILAWSGSVALEMFPHNEEHAEYWFVGRIKCLVPAVLSSHEQSKFPLPLIGDQLLSKLGGICCRNVPVNWAWGAPPYTVAMASAGGLICTIVCLDVGTDGCVIKSEVIVFNCLTGSLKVLPQPLYVEGLLMFRCPALVYMATDDQDPCRYYIMLTYTGLMQLSDLHYFELFDSGTGSWKVGSWDTVKSSWLDLMSAHFFHVIYDFGSCSMDVMGYHTAKNVWNSVSVPFAGVEYPLCLHKYKGRLFQGRWRKDSYVVLELQFTSSTQVATWMEVSRTPECLKHRPCTSVSLQAEGGLFYTKAYFDFDGMCQAAPLVYDLDRDLWYAPPMHLHKGHDFLFVLRPRLGMFFC